MLQRASVSIAIAAAVLAAAHAETFSQTYPSKPVRIIVPHPVGGGSDGAARGIGVFLGSLFGQPFVIDNRVAANGIVGLEACARAVPDGYTLCSTNQNTISITPAFTPNLPYDPLRDFAPIINIGANDTLVLVNPAVPAKSMRELIELAKARPGKINWGSLGNATNGHLYIEWFKSNGVEFFHVPYKGGPPALTALMSGEVQIVLYGVGASMPLIKAGKIRALAVSSAKRSQFAPDVPSFKEAGLDLWISTWNGMFAPAGTPREVVQRLNAEIGRLLADPKFKALHLDVYTMEPAGGSPEEFAEFLRSDREKFTRLAKLANVRPE